MYHLCALRKLVKQPHLKQPLFFAPSSVCYVSRVFWNPKMRYLGVARLPFFTLDQGWLPLFLDLNRVKIQLISVIFNKEKG